MAITTALVTSLAGGGQTFAKTFSGNTNATRTVGEEGKAYIVHARTWGSASTRVGTPEVVIANGNNSSDPLSFEGVEVFSGPVTIMYVGNSKDSRATVLVIETTSF